jgi:peptidyl-prolyl cis-trans isomerase C
MRLYLPVFRVAALWTILLSCVAPSSALAGVIARVEGVEITEQDLQFAEEDLSGAIPQGLAGDQKTAFVLDYLIDMRLAARKAEADHFAESTEFKRKLAFLRDKALMESLLSKVARESLTEAETKKVYETAARAQTPEIEFRARHILVETEVQARAVWRRVLTGEDFAKLADELSRDPGSKGGDLGWFIKERMVPEFAEAAAKLQPGQTSEPIRTQFGWHVIRLEAKREKPFPPLEEVREQIERYVVQKAQTDVIMALRAKARIEREASSSSSAR